MKNFWKGVGKALVFCGPAVFCVIGFSFLEGESLINALFNCVSMYVLNYSDPPVNLFVELARWMAPLATAGGVFLAVSALQERARNALRYRRGNSVAVYGPQGAKDALLSQLGARGIEGKEELVPACRYILLGDEEENFDFYFRNRAALKGRTVYLQSRAAPAQTADPALRLFCSEETAARLFWKQRPLFSAVQQNPRLKIVFLGFGALGEQLLYYGLLDNIFRPDQRLEYHIFGDGKRFSAIRSQLDQLEDKIVFHPEPWYDCLELLEEAQTVIVLEQKNQLALLQDLLLACRRPLFHVFAASNATQLLDGQNRLSLFDWKNQACQAEHILGDSLFDKAQRVNLRYAHLYSGIAETPENKMAEWNKLDAFTRYSNVSAADYHEIRLQMLETLGLPQQPESWPPETMELLAQLEHIRWQRYHYLHNWQYGRPETGAKDPVRRIHINLLPYDQLSEADKEKDRDNIRLLLSLQSNL